MPKITISKIEYQRLQHIARRYTIIKQLLEPEILVRPPVKDIRRIVREFRETGLYSNAFLKSLERGMKESSYFSSPRTRAEKS